MKKLESLSRVISRPRLATPFVCGVRALLSAIFVRVVCVYVYIHYVCGHIAFNEQCAPTTFVEEWGAG